MLDPAGRQTATVGWGGTMRQGVPLDGVTNHIDAKVSTKGSWGRRVPLPHLFEGLAAGRVRDLPQY